MTLPVTEKILRLNEVKAQTGLSTSTIYAWIKEGKFPQKFNLGNRSVGWKQTDISNWIDSRSVSMEAGNV